MFKIDTVLLDLLFDRLNSEKIEFLVLRNYSGLPDCANAKDVDILVSSHLLPSKVNSIIHVLCDELKLKLVWLNELDYLSGFVLARETSDGVIAYVKLDFFFGLRWRGLDFLDSKSILAARLNVNNFHIPSPGHESAIHLINGLLYGKQLNAKYESSTRKGYLNDRLSFDSLLANSGLESMGGALGSLISNEFTKNASDQFLKGVRLELMKLLIRKQFSLIMIYRSLRSIKSEIINRRHFGYLVSFSGPDGAGKSSIVDPVLDFFCLTGICKQEVPHHFLPANIPPLHSLIRVNKKLTQQKYTEPYSEKPVGKIPSILRFSYYVFAFSYAKYKYLMPQFKQNEVVIFDRYYPDIIADPARARLSLGRSVISFVLSSVSARPDVAMVFVASPEVLIKRKGELSEDKAKQLVVDYRSICAGRNYILIENNGTLSEGLASCFDKLFGRLHEINIKKLHVCK